MKKKLNLFKDKGLTLLPPVASLRRIACLIEVGSLFRGSLLTIFTFAGFALSGFVGCSDSLAPTSLESPSNPALTSVSKRGAELQSVQSIGLAPIYFAEYNRTNSAKGGSSRTKGDSSRVAWADSSVSQDDVKALNDELLKSFDAELSLKVLHLYKGGNQAGKASLGGIGGGLGGKAFDFASSADVGADAISLGRIAGVDAVLITNMKSYQERIGSAIGADAPARVSFTMSLLRVSDRSEIWSAIYTFQDRSLLDNLTTLGPAQEGGIGWRKAREIVMQAFTNSARDLEDKRLVQFLKR